MAMDWEYTIASATSYLSSCVLNDFLLVAYLTPDSDKTTYFDLIWTETGRKWAFHSTEPGKLPSKIISMETSGEFGIYALEQFARADGSGTYRVRLFRVEIEGGSTELAKLLTVNEKEVPGSAEVKGSFEKYPPNRLHLYYLDDAQKQVPGVLLTAHREIKGDYIGLLIYGFTDSGSSKYGHNPFAFEKGGMIGVSDNQYVECGTEFFRNFECNNPSNGCPFYTYKIEPNICANCHYACAECTGPLANQCLSCRRDGVKFSTQLGQCFPGFTHSDSVWVPSGHKDLGFRFGYRRDKCPPYAFDVISDLGEAFQVPADPNPEITFYELKGVCIDLPGQNGLSSMPSEFTVSLWAKIKVTDDKTFISAFGNLKLAAKGSTVEIRLPGLSPSAHTVPYIWASSANNADWTFFSVSIKNSAFGYTITPFVTRYCVSGCLGLSSDQLFIESYTANSNAPLIFPGYENFIRIGCNTEGYIPCTLRCYLSLIHISEPTRPY
eukprot:TRINITY_DN9605_c0_g1_i4.p1 TRINITY_DN9605_c0_g1~~TRINITY_DN9605_c0_g1_i4.p1  ORF type:complete len:494 (-),score=57.19 TRINITY_DN9605_c0_g1_i4:48-1529(-)